MSKPRTRGEVKALRARRKNGEKLTEEEKDFLEYCDLCLGETFKQLELMFFTAGAGLLKLTDMVQHFAKQEMNLLFIGEPGTGKELLAEVYAETINRKRISVNCAGVNKDLAASKLFGHVKGAYTGADKKREGLFATAKDGVVFLDELGSSDDDFQVQLLRVLETGDFQPLGEDETQKINNVLIIAATSEPDKLRPELRDRFVTLYVPPLREHLPDLLAFLADMLEYKISISKKALEALMKHPWPGNFRELKKTAEIALGLAVMDNSYIIRLQHLPTITTSPAPDKSAAVDLDDEYCDLAKALPRDYFFRPPNQKQCADQKFSLSPNRYKKEFLDYYRSLGYTATDLSKKYPDTSVSTFQSALKTKK